jgi:hypothetical protein
MATRYQQTDHLNYFVHKFQSLKKELYKKSELTGFEEIDKSSMNFFDRVEFQDSRVPRIPTAVTG